MQRENQRLCHICQRLGKTQCGYHKFKNDFLSRMEGSCQRQNYFAQTQSSIHGKSQMLYQNSSNRSLTPERIQRTVVNVPYSAPKMPEPRPIMIENTPPRLETSYLSVPNHNRTPELQQRVMPIENHIIRQEGNQVVYYPIYPVYEIVYEPVQMHSNSQSRGYYN